MITAILFDFNATLIHCPEWMDLEIRRLPHAALARLAEAGHIPAPTPAHLARAEAAFRESRQAANASGRETNHEQDLAAILAALEWDEMVAEAHIADTVAALHRACLPAVQLLPHAAETVSLLHGAGWRLGIISNAAYAPFLHWTLDKFQLADAFEQVVVSADVGWRKPHPKIFDLALKALSLSPGEAVYVGDDFAKDVAAPRQAGLRALWYRPDLQGPAPPPGSEPFEVITSLAEIPGWLERQR